VELIQQVQSQIEGVYGVRVGQKAADYLIGGQELSELLQIGDGSDLPRELFLVNPSPQDDTLEIALYLNESLTSNLANNSPLKSLNSHNVSDFCTLIEGVSHFVYYLHKMGLEHNVSQLELELQAEIDKYILLCLFSQGGDLPRHRLMDLLFEDYYLHARLSPEQIERYETATSLARSFCYKLSKNFSRDDIRPLIARLRHFYFLPQDEKIREIMQ
jgi:hypothetical protein